MTRLQREDLRLRLVCFLVSPGIAWVNFWSKILGFESRFEIDRTHDSPIDPSEL